VYESGPLIITMRNEEKQKIYQNFAMIHSIIQSW